MRAMSIAIRKLTPADAAAYHALRLRALEEHPESFLITPDEEADVDAQRERLAKTEGREDDVIFGAFDDAFLVGMSATFRQTPNRIRGRHRAMIWGVYVAPEVRGQGVGRRLTGAAIDVARNAEGIELIHIGVAVESVPARALYASLGFETWGVERNSARLDGRYIDTEMMVLFL